MNRMHKLAGLLGALLFFAAVAPAQEKPKPAETFGTPIKVQVTFSEFDGDSRISNTLYTIALRAGATDRSLDSTSLRVGIRMPVSAGSSKGEGSQVTYQDVGTNIDCAAQGFENGAYYLNLSIDRSSVSIRGPNGEEAEWKPGADAPLPQPILRSFRDSFELVMRDGQSMEGTSAVDPVTGHVLKVEVTLNVLK
jgi:hypothetical protein